MDTPKTAKRRPSKTEIEPEQIKSGNAVVTIYTNVNPRRPSGKDYKLVWRDMDGRRKFNSFTSYKDAREKADDILTRANRGELDTLSMTKADLLLFTRAVQSLKPWGIPLDTAAVHFAEACKALGGDMVVEAARQYAKTHPKNMPQKTVQKVYDELIKAKTAAKRSPVYVADLRYRCGTFADAFNCQIASVIPEDVRRFLDSLKLSPRSHNNFVRSVRTLFEFAKNRGYLASDHNIMQGIELQADTGEEIEVFSPEELTRLLAKASSDLVPVLAIGAFSGLRSAEILRLTWDEVNMAERLITVAKGKAKTRSRRTVPILDNLSAWLASYAQSSGLVWPHSQAYLYESLANLAESTEEPAQGSRRKKPPVHWKPNGLRHSFISYRLAEIKNEGQVAMEAGNSPQMVHGFYKGLVMEKQSKAWFAIAPEQPTNVINATPAVAAAG